MPLAWTSGIMTRPIGTFSQKIHGHAMALRRERGCQQREGQRQHSEAQRVGVHGPFQRRQRCVQAEPDDGQSGRDDLGV